MSQDFEALVAGHICLDIQPDLSGAGREPFEDIFSPATRQRSAISMIALGSSVENGLRGLV
jgi:hypothetical protein